MEQYGQVVDQMDQQRALVRVRQHLSCASCGKCGGTFLGDPGKRMDHLVEVLNPIGAGKGALVRLEARASEMILAAFLLYILPLLALLAGLFAGRNIAASQGFSGHPDLWGAILGVVLMVVVFAVLKAKDAQFSRSKRFKAVITAVIEEDDIPKDFLPEKGSGDQGCDE